MRGVRVAVLTCGLAGLLWAQSALPGLPEEGPTGEPSGPGVLPTRSGSDLVTVAVSLEPAAPPTGGECTLLVQVVPAPGLHLYRDRVRFEWTQLQGVGEPRLHLPPAQRTPGLAGGGSPAVYRGEVTFRVSFPVTGRPAERLTVSGVFHYQACTDRVCYPPASFPFSCSAVIGPPEKPAGVTGAATATGSQPPSTPRPAGGPPVEPASERTRSTFLKWVLALAGAFGAGVLLSLTPCVYPMVPITAAVVAGAVSRGGAEEAEGRKVSRALAASLIYVLGLSVVYALLGLASAALGGVLREWLQSAVVRVPMSALFVLLALVTFEAVGMGGGGAWASRLQRLGVRAGYPGLFLVGAASGLVVSPCVSAPLAALLAQIARTGDRWLGFWTLFSLGWGMGLLLVVVGTFSATVLPRAGAWMYTVRNLFGFVMLWAAVWILQPVLGQNLYYLGSGLVVLAGVVYLGGLDALSAESGFWARSKRFVGLAASAVGMVYLVVGLAGLVGLELGPGAGEGGSADQGIPFVETDARGLERALKSGRPVLVDFYADWCVACKELERTAFRDPEVVRTASQFTALRVDFDRNPDLVRRFGILGVPTTLLFAPGEETPRRVLVGWVAPETLLEALRQVLSVGPAPERPPGNPTGP